MCGIIGATAERGIDVAPMVIDALGRLDYRGYDSCGIAALNGSIEVLRRVGESKVLEAAFQKDRLVRHLSASVAIGHTRWATEGEVTEENAHPHVSGHLALIHNGTIKNWRDLKEKLVGEGYVFQSQTDTEVIAHLVNFYCRTSKSLRAAVQRAVKDLEGSYALVVSSTNEPGVLVGTRNRPPLIVGLGEGENFLCSDVTGVLAKTRQVIYLWDGDVAEVTPRSVRIVDVNGKRVRRKVYISKQSLDALEKGTFAHFMLKEIFHQPQALRDTIEPVLEKGFSPALFGRAGKTFKDIDSILILACGTSAHAGETARSWFQSIAKVPTEVQLASEYVSDYLNGALIPNPRTLVVTISQSGETFDTMEALKIAKESGHPYTLSICNVPESSIPRASKLVFYTQAGVEIGVASTKAFTTQLAALFVLAHTIAKAKSRLTKAAEAEALGMLKRIPDSVNEVLKVEALLRGWARELAKSSSVLYLGKGMLFPIAKEGALKLKEISYIHAEALAGGELKHGSLALVDEKMRLVVCAPYDALYSDIEISIGEVAARKGDLYVLTDKNSPLKGNGHTHVMRMPEHDQVLAPLVYTIVLQILAYYTALELEQSIDKPRNLAKSVTTG